MNKNAVRGCKQLVPSIEQISKIMEEMANAPREEYGKRYPGERGAYEIQRRAVKHSRVG